MTYPISYNIAQQVRSIYFGTKNWTDTNLKIQLETITWEQATTKIQNFNTIVATFYHLHYYLRYILSYLNGNKLNANDAESFNHPIIDSQIAWQNLLNNAWNEAEEFAQLIEQMTEKELLNTFEKPAYGNYYSNITGLLQHTYYHFGQIIILKKLYANWHNNNSPA